MSNEESSLKPGELITDGDRRRDAFHVAVAPVTAGVSLQPGEHVGLVDNRDTVAPCDDNVGIVGPFLPKCVEPGQRFLLWLYPNTVTGMRHVWSHPAFIPRPKRNADVGP